MKTFELLQVTTTTTKAMSSFPYFYIQFSYMLKCNKHGSTEVKYEIYVKEHTLKRQVNTN